ncbi:MAG: glycosyltransferase family 4 protein [Gallionellaceae bacterium]|jgi:glycosyltransferase involved in cell wall biosynthesis
MNILFIGHGLNFGGASESLFILINGLLKLGNTVKVVVPIVDDPAAKLRLENLGVSVTIIDCGQFHSNQAGRTPFYRLPLEITNYYRNKSRLIEYIHQNSFDVVHLNSSVLAHLLEPIKKSKAANKLFIHVRELLSSRYDPYLIGATLISRIHQWADHVVCISENEASRLQQNNNISIVYNPFDFNPNEVIACGANQATEKFRILMMGQFHQGKGQIDFLRAIRLFIDNSPELAAQCSFVLLGYMKRNKSGFLRRLKSSLRKSYEEQFFEVLRELKLENLVEIIPYKKDIKSELDSASIVVRTSISGDPWGRDIIESMSHGKAIIATGTYAGFVRPGINGELVTPCNPIEIAEALKKIVPDNIEIYGKNSLELATQLFNADTHAKKINDLYMKVINEDRI